MSALRAKDHAVVAREAWLEARRALLAREKEHTSERDRLAEARRAMPWLRVEEAPGASAFARTAEGDVFLTYQCFSRGLDALNPGYQLLDLVAKGRDEGGEGMKWLRRRDEYGS